MDILINWCVHLFSPYSVNWDYLSLLHSGADVNATSVNKRTVLHEAAQFGFYDVVKLLLDHKANPDVRETITNNTPAELASLHKHHKVSLR